MIEKRADNLKVFCVMERNEWFDRETRYQVMQSILRNMLSTGIISEEDFAKAECLLNDMYQPIFRDA